jgi:hypothetical protein
MSMRTLKITVSKTGDATVEVDGVSDAKCVDITKPIEEMLGKVTKRTLKSEAYTNGANVEKIVQR